LPACFNIDRLNKLEIALVCPELSQKMKPASISPALDVNSTPMPDPIRKEEVNIALTWTADARTELAIRRQANLMGFETPADYLTQMIAVTLASDDKDTVITKDGRLVHLSGTYNSESVPLDV
jgi:hypothetical protein